MLIYLSRPSSTIAHFHDDSKWGAAKNTRKNQIGQVGEVNTFKDNALNADST